MLNTLLGFLIGLFVHLLINKLYGKDSFFKKLEQEKTKLQYEVNTLHENTGSLETLLNTKNNELDEERRKNLQLQDLYDRETENNRKILSQKKSSEIRTGFIAESLAPFMMDKHDPKNLRFMGQPIDYVCFQDDGIYFIEVKSGKSDLSFNQKKIKKLVLENKVYWEEFRISGKNLKKEINNEVDSRKGKKSPNSNS